MSPQVIAIAGPNGAGKSTLAPFLLRDMLGMMEYINADTIALGLSFNVESVAFDAGRIMLRRMEVLASKRVSFGFESTLAGRSHAMRISRWREQGYDFHLLFIWLCDAEVAVQRVRQRVRMGGHGIPAEVVRRRYRNGLRNFFKLYQPLAETWVIYDNSTYNNPHLIATGGASAETTVADEQAWRQFCKAAK